MLTPLYSDRMKMCLEKGLMHRWLTDPFGLSPILLDGLEHKCGIINTTLGRMA